MSKQERVDALMARPIDWPMHRDAVRMIALEEDCRLSSYLCDAGVWTNGWGETSGVKPGMRWTQEYADGRLLASLTEYSAAVEGMLKVPTTPEQLGALVSLSYNIGLAGLRGSTVLRRHNAGDTAGAARAFGMWNKAKKDGVLKPHPVLEARRMTEAALYLRMDPEAPAVRSVQAVEPEQTASASARVQTGSAVAGLGVLGAVGEAKEALGPVGEGVAAAKGFLTDALGIPMQYLPMALLVGVGAFLVWHFWKQRRQGVA